MVEGIYNYLKKAGKNTKGQPPPSSVDEMSKFITNHCIEFINTSTMKSKYSDLTALQTFANYITNEVCQVKSYLRFHLLDPTDQDKADQEAELFEDFREKIDERLHKMEDEDPKHAGMDSDERQKPKKKDSKEKNGKENSKSVERSDQEKAYATISKAAQLLYEVKDVRDELTILSDLLAQQDTVWRQLLGLPTNNGKSTKEENSDSKEKIKTFKELGLAIRDVEVMSKSAQIIQESVSLF